eukprot:7388798-Prymnesium_polylepis.1
MSMSMSMSMWFAEGAIAVRGGQLEMTAAIIRHCKGDAGGAIKFTQGRGHILTDVTIEGCESNTEGGGLTIWDASVELHGCRIINCTSTANSGALLGGGGVCIRGSG